MPREPESQNEARKEKRGCSSRFPIQMTFTSVLVTCRGPSETLLTGLVVWNNSRSENLERRKDQSKTNGLGGAGTCSFDGNCLLG